MTRTNIVGALSVAKLKASLGQSLLSFSFDVGGLFTGALLVFYSGVLSVSGAPWALLLYPGILSVRGAVGGLFSGHLGTGLHLGTVKASFRGNTRDFGVLFRVVVTLAFVSGVFVGVGAWVFGLFLWDASWLDFVQLLAVIVATMGLSVVFVSPITMVFSVLSFRRGLDPDVIVYPVTSTMSDIINTCCYILCLSLFFLVEPFGRYLIWVLDLVFVAVVVYFVVKYVNETKFAETIKEFLVTLVFVTVVANVTGSFLNKIGGVGRGRSIFAVYPAIITTVGGVGSIIGSTATTKLALGLIKPSFGSIREHVNEVVGAWLASLVMFTVYAFLSLNLIGVTSLLVWALFWVQLLVTNVLAVSVMVFVSFAVAILTFRHGWNPDNFVIPIESSLADTITTAAALLVLMLVIV
jgi:mgtE-like transporter